MPNRYPQEAMIRDGRRLLIRPMDASDGDALHGKVFLCAITAGGAEAAYRAEGYNHFTIRELLQPLEQTAMLCGMTYLPPFALFGSRTAIEEGRVGRHIADWVWLLEAIRDDRIDIPGAQELPQLNSVLSQESEED